MLAMLEESVQKCGLCKKRVHRNVSFVRKQCTEMWAMLENSAQKCGLY